jgi:putative peptidoglycan lipid II flippase
MSHAGLELAARVFFAMQDTITPLLVAACAGLAYIATGILLMGVLGHGGLALANSLIITAELLTLLWLLRRRLGGVEGWRTLRTLGRVAVACAAMSAAIWWVQLLLRDAGVLTLLVLSGLVGLTVFIAAGWLARVPIIVELPALLGRGTPGSTKVPS